VPWWKGLCHGGKICAMVERFAPWWKGLHMAENNMGRNYEQSSKPVCNMANLSHRTNATHTFCSWYWQQQSPNPKELVIHERHIFLI
jgi:hypothetical protein